MDIKVGKYLTKGGDIVEIAHMDNIEEDGAIVRFSGGSSGWVSRADIAARVEPQQMEAHAMSLPSNRFEDLEAFPFGFTANGLVTTADMPHAHEWRAELSLDHGVSVACSTCDARKILPWVGKAQTLAGVYRQLAEAEAEADRLRRLLHAKETPYADPKPLYRWGSPV
jgi:hypothetical protein